jgi:hypothetical protein
MDYPIQTPDPLHNTIWTAYNHGRKDEEDGVSRKAPELKGEAGKKIGNATNKNFGGGVTRDMNSLHQPLLFNVYFRNMGSSNIVI